LEITGFSAMDTESPQPERRRHPRLPYGKQAVVWPRMGGGSKAVFVRDISISGLSLIDNQPMKTGERFEICLTPPTGRPVTVECAAQRCAPSAVAHQFLIGAIFKRIIEPADLAATIKADIDDDLIAKAIGGS
jgi:hypothetical protein